MGVRNYLIEGVSGSGKTAVCDELQRRGYQAVHGDRELAYADDQGHHIWDVKKVKELVTSQDEPVTFFCGGSRNSSRFIHLFDGVFVLQVDAVTMNNRIDERVLADPSDWGGTEEERAIITRLHETQEDVPEGTAIDATPPVATVVDEILRRVLGSG